MAKTLKTAAQLTALINAELSKHAVCSHTGAEGWCISTAPFGHWAVV